MRLVAMLFGLFVATPALAGGVGPLVLGGFHTETVYSYCTTRDCGGGRAIRDAANYDQQQQTQLIGTAGAGLELVLGDRDNLIQGVFRAFWMLDLPQNAPASDAELQDGLVVANWREELRHTGVGTVGLSFGVVRAANDRFKFSLVVHAGAGFASPEREEFLLAQAGGNLNYLITRRLEVYLDVAYGLRFRNEFSHGLYNTAGLRVMFD